MVLVEANDARLIFIQIKLVSMINSSKKFSFVVQYSQIDSWVASPMFL